MDPVTSSSNDPMVLIRTFEDLFGQLKSFNSTYGRDPRGVDDETRKELLEACRKASAVLETPFETMQRVNYSPFTLIVLRVATGYGILNFLDEARLSGVPCKVVHLAKETGIEHGVLVALLDRLCSEFIVREVSPDEYMGTAICKDLATPEMIDAFATFHDLLLPVWSQLYKSLAPGETRTGWEIAHNTEIQPYQWWESHPEDGALLHRYFTAQFKDLPSWLDGIDFAIGFAKGASSEDVLLVDVGGGNGQESELLRSKFPDCLGRVILQDLPAVLERAPELKRIEKMAHDYFTEQPVHGARVYYFRQIFHNNSDENCIAILSNHRPAMTSHSVILIDEKVLPDVTDASQLYTSALSLNMSINFRGLERKKRQWLKLMEAADFEIRDMRRYTAFGDCIISVVPRTANTQA
ncbi:putative O-methyltransferase [Rhizodiscina lignyota]|uniref:O-methyltransferase n=1 Tax=Rhizodiscina lignyota TaxID=1504668 RepID=A0A9P4ILR3_9PEZI|nr:putative O-methyltransferase [Rhizodiscina lignyota]